MTIEGRRGYLCAVGGRVLLQRDGPRRRLEARVPRDVGPFGRRDTQLVTLCDTNRSARVLGQGDLAWGRQRAIAIIAVHSVDHEQRDRPDAVDAGVNVSGGTGDQQARLIRHLDRSADLLVAASRLRQRVRAAATDISAIAKNFTFMVASLIRRELDCLTHEL
jgi:hypothetical protein